MTNAQLALLAELLQSFSDAYEDAIGTLDRAGVDIARMSVAAILEAQLRETAR